MLTVSTVPLVLCTALVALTLLISGIAKAKDPQSTVTGIQNLGLEKIAPTRAVSLILPWFEIALAAVLLLSPVRLPAPGRYLERGLTESVPQSAWHCPALARRCPGSRFFSTSFSMSPIFTFW